jgi:hypothetical protein
MTSNPFSRVQELLDADNDDANELIAQEMMAEGLSGEPGQDTWQLNSRIAHRHFETHARLRKLSLTS